MLGRLSDQKLAKRAADGDRGAFDEIVTRHRDRVFTIALRICGNRDDAEDVLQETFISAYRALPRFRGGAQLSTWLYRIAVNKSYDLIGRRRPQTALEDVGEPVTRTDDYEASSQRTALVQAIEALPPEFRAVAVLCDVLGLTPTEAAEVLEIPAGTVKSRSFRARAMLAKTLTDREPSAADAV